MTEYREGIQSDIRYCSCTNTCTLLYALIIVVLVMSSTFIPDKHVVQKKIPLCHLCEVVATACMCALKTHYKHSACLLQTI